MSKTKLSLPLMAIGTAVMLLASYWVNAQQTNNCIGVTNVEYNNTCNSGGSTILKSEYTLNGNPFMVACTTSVPNTHVCHYATQSTSGVSLKYTTYDCNWVQQGTTTSTVSATAASCP